MKIDIEALDKIAEQLQEAWCNVPDALWKQADEAYRLGALSRGRLDPLGFSFVETEVFLKKYQAFLDYVVEDLEKDRATLEALFRNNPHLGDHKT